MGGFLSALLLVTLAGFCSRGRSVFLVLDARDGSAWSMFIAMILGYGATAGIAVIFGGLVSQLVPFSILKYSLVAAFVLLGLLMLSATTVGGDRQQEAKGLPTKIRRRAPARASVSASERDARRAAPLWLSFLIVLRREMGSKTQLTAAAVAAGYRGGLPVFFGSVAGVVVLNAIFAFFGTRMLSGFAAKGMKRLSALVFFVFGVAGLWVLPEGRLENRSDESSISSMIPNFRKINEKLYAGAQPGETGVRRLTEMGIRTIVNLDRSVFEKEPKHVKKERKWAEHHGMKFYRVPMHPLFAPKKEEVDKAMRLITDPDNQPVYVHCHEGKDRTGIVIAAYRVKVDGWSRKRAYEEMKKYGFHGALFWWKRSFSASRESEQVKPTLTPRRVVGFGLASATT